MTLNSYNILDNFINPTLITKFFSSSAYSRNILHIIFIIFIHCIFINLLYIYSFIHYPVRSFIYYDIALPCIKH